MKHAGRRVPAPEFVHSSFRLLSFFWGGARKTGLPDWWGLAAGHPRSASKIFSRYPGGNSFARLGTRLNAGPICVMSISQPSTSARRRFRLPRLVVSRLHVILEGLPWAHASSSALRGADNGLLSELPGQVSRPQRKRKPVFQNERQTPEPKRIFPQLNTR
jgi:hypothetical protein